MRDKKIYLGDGVYAWDDGFHIVLEADNDAGKRIYLDEKVIESLWIMLKAKRGPLLKELLRWMPE